MNRRKLIKSGLATIGASVIPAAASVVPHINPPKIYTKDELIFTPTSDDMVIVRAKDDNGTELTIPYSLSELIGNGTNKDIIGLYVNEFNQKVFMEKYLPHALKILSPVTHKPSNIDWRNLGEFSKNFVSVIPDDAEFVLATPKSCVMFQLSMQFRVDSETFKSFRDGSLLQKIGFYKNIPIYCDAIVKSHTESFEYIITDKCMVFVEPGSFNLPH